MLAMTGCEKTAVDQCLEGATSVDGVPCCSAVIPQSSCSTEGQVCIDDVTTVCGCRSGKWKCDNLPIEFDLSVPDLSARD
jgi:hypothetical protein